MVQTGRIGGLWQSIKDVPGRMPLRTKLISAVLALVAVALVVISLAGLLILRNDLLAPYDAVLQSGQVARIEFNGVANYLSTGNSQQASQPGIAAEWISAGGSVHDAVIPIRSGQSYPGPYVPGSATATAGPNIPSSIAWQAAHLGKPTTVGATSGSARWRVLLEPQQFTNTVTGASVSGTVVQAIDVSSVYNTIGQLAYIDLLASLAVICVLGILVVALIRRSLRPLIDIEQTAGTIAAGDLSQRVPELDPRTEVGRLGRSLNVMLGQIESAYHAREQGEESALRSEQRMRQFVADASHELRTPLTTVRGFAEYYRRRGGVDTNGSGTGELSPAELNRIMRRVEQESERMGILVDELLLLARLDEQRPLSALPVDLLTLAADAVHDARVVAPNRNVNLTVGSGAALLVNGDEAGLRQVIGNLMSNALSHTPDGTPIDVLIRSGNLDEAPPPPVESDDGETSTAASFHRANQPAAVLEVRDHGPGLTREQAEHVFERFYRTDQARTAGGTGLGLAIVAAMVAAHGGTTWVRSEPGEGATFAFALPLTPEAAQSSSDDFTDAEDELDQDAAEDDSTDAQAASTRRAALRAESR